MALPQYTEIMTQRLEQILKEQELTHLIELFSAEGITDSVLGDLSDAELQSIGITQLGVRKRLLKEFADGARLGWIDPNQSASDKIVTTDVSKPGDGVEMIPVAGGVLPAISPFPDAEVGAFLIARTQITLAQWRKTRRWAQANAYGFEIGDAPGSDYPVTCVTWLDALKWCNARSEMEHLQPVYFSGNSIFRKDEDIDSLIRNPHANGYRLPLEKEWFWAASGAAKGGGCRFSGSNNCDAVGWFHEEATRPVAEKEPNELGLYDMSGNVWEWGEGDSFLGKMPAFGGPVYVDKFGFKYVADIYMSYSRSFDIFSHDQGFRPVRNSTIANDRTINVKESNICLWKKELIPSNPINWIKVQGGTFSNPPDIPVQRINDFFLAKTPITLKQWRNVYLKASKMGYNITEGDAPGPNHPVSYISWSDAIKWCNAKSELDGLLPVYMKGEAIIKTDNHNVGVSVNPQANGCRLPTLAEWHWAADGGQCSRGRRFSFDRWVLSLNRDLNSPTQPVGIRPPNELDLCDLSDDFYEFLLDDKSERGFIYAASGCVFWGIRVARSL